MVAGADTHDTNVMNEVIVGPPVVVVRPPEVILRPPAVIVR
jgi:hypothetical protein